MLDINLIRNEPEVVEADLKKRGEPLDRLNKVKELDTEWRKILQDVEKLKHEKNVNSKSVAEAKKSGKDASSLINEMQAINKQIDSAEKESNELLRERDAELMRLPNILEQEVPVGADDEENVEVRKWSKPKEFKFEVKSHGEIAETLGVADFDKAGEVAGAGFNYLKGPLAMLDQALGQFGIGEMTKKDYTLIFPPYMLNRKAYEGVTDLGDFEDVMYKLDDEDLHLIATSEHPICAMLMNEVIPEEELPLKFVGWSACFRKEIGSHGVDTKGLFRMHQFNKVEQFVFCHPDESKKYHEEIIDNAEQLFKKLELPYRVVDICTGDIGTVAARKYDIEAWSPRQKKYVEVVSGSNCTDYQARRLNIKFGKRGGDKEFVHTLNSTAIATSRALVAILENHQQEDGTVKIPKALHPYMHGVKEITALK